MKETAQGRVPITEDSVIEHDAQGLVGFNLVESDMTEPRVFARGQKHLENITANRQ